MVFDWIQFLEGRGITYNTRGPNVSRGYVTVSCPFCPNGDPTGHMSLSLERGSWKCWRNQSDHRGSKPHRLIQAMIQCSYEEACSIVGDDGFSLGTAESFDEQINALLEGRGNREKPKNKLKFLPEMRPLEDEGMGRAFVEYLHEERFYTRREALRLGELYDLQFAVTGKFAYRLIIPVYMDFGLANWTGRAISSRAAVRYRTLTTDPEKAADDNLPPARCSIEETVWNYGELLDERACDTLVLVEGPLDALRVDFFGRKWGVRATCLFGKNMSAAQVQLLESLADIFSRRIVLLDVDASMDALRMNSRLSHLGFQFMTVPKGAKDPAEMEPEEIADLGS